MTERELLNTLVNATNPATRDAAAIALADLKSPQGVLAIKKLLQNPATTGERGSLLYALREARAALGLSELVELMLTDAPEAREEAFLFLENGLVARVTVAEHRQAVERLRQAAGDGQQEDIRSLACDALALLEDRSPRRRRMA